MLRWGGFIYMNWQNFASLSQTPPPPIFFVLLKNARKGRRSVLRSQVSHNETLQYLARSHCSNSSWLKFICALNSSMRRLPWPQPIYIIFSGMVTIPFFTGLNQELHERGSLVSSWRTITQARRSYYSEIWPPCQIHSENREYTAGNFSTVWLTFGTRGFVWIASPFPVRLAFPIGGTNDRGRFQGVNVPWGRKKSFLSIKMSQTQTHEKSSQNIPKKTYLVDAIYNFPSSCKENVTCLSSLTPHENAPECGAVRKRLSGIVPSARRPPCLSALSGPVPHPSAPPLPEIFWDKSRNSGQRALGKEGG